MGQGSYGSVDLCRDVNTNKEFVLKKVLALEYIQCFLGPSYAMFRIFFCINIELIARSFSEKNFDIYENVLCIVSNENALMFSIVCC